MFYSLEDGYLLSSLLVERAGYMLCEVGHQNNEYTYPIDGWYWFNSEEEAKAFFNLQEL